MQCSYRSDDPIPRPQAIESIACNTSKSYNGHDTCFPVDRIAERAWSLKQVFGRPIRGACPLSNEKEIVKLEIASDREVVVTAAGAYNERKSNNNHVRHYELPVQGNFDFALSEQPLIPSDSLEQPRLYVERTFVGHGQERGGVRTVLTNPSSSESAELVYLESLPWFMKPYLHTLHATVSTSTLKNAIKDIVYRPAIDRQHGTHLELQITVPASSTVTLTYDFEKAFLRYTEYPPDANRGFDVAPAIVRLLPSIQGKDSIYLRTTSLLLPLPTPDFSMPYNVIILTSTVIAMAFGSIFNLLVRRFVAADEAEGAGFNGIKERVKGRLRLLKEKLVGSKEKEKKDQ